MELVMVPVTQYRVKSVSKKSKERQCSTQKRRNFSEFNSSENGLNRHPVRFNLRLNVLGSDAHQNGRGFGRDQAMRGRVGRRLEPS